jgi:hypothetical protein
MVQIFQCNPWYGHEFCEVRHSSYFGRNAYLKGIGDFDAEKALEACVATANLDEKVKESLLYYLNTKK